MKKRQSAIQFFAVIYLFISISSLLCAQKNERNYRNGYIIQLGGDTIKGGINNTGLNDPFQRISFRPSQQDTVVSFRPTDLRGYFRDGDGFYQSGAINLEEETINRHFFLKKLIAGDIQLFRLDYQIKADETPLWQIENVFYFVKTPDNTSHTHLRREEYRFQLNRIFGNCKSAKSGEYTDAGLVDLISEYASCSAANITNLYIARKPGPKPRLGLYVGAGQSLVEPGHPVFEDFAFSADFAFSTGVFIELPVYRILSVRGGLSYFSRKTTGERVIKVDEFYANEGENLMLKGRVNLHYISAPVDLKLTLSNGRIKPYLLAGGSFGIGVNNSASLEKAYFYHDGSASLPTLGKKENAPYNYSIAHYDIGWRLGVGIALAQKRGDTFLEFLFAKSKNDAEKGELAYFASQFWGLSLGKTF